MKVIGLTGSFGTGKTFVASIFRSLGAQVVDADRIAHRVIREGAPAYKKVVRSFGKDILNSAGEIDRSKLGAVVFSNKAALRKLNEIVHPLVVREIKRSIRAAKGDDVVVIDAPLLVEAGLGNLVDKLVVVKCQKRRQIERCREKFCMRKREILKRIGSQIPLKKKLKMADLVIDNSRTRAYTKRQVRKAWEEKLWR